MGWAAGGHSSLTHHAAGPTSRSRRMGRTLRTPRRAPARRAPARREGTPAIRSVWFSARCSERITPPGSRTVQNCVLNAGQGTDGDGATRRCCVAAVPSPAARSPYPAGRLRRRSAAKTGPRRSRRHSRLGPTAPGRRTGRRRYSWLARCLSSASMSRSRSSSPSASTNSESCNCKPPSKIPNPNAVGNASNEHSCNPVTHHPRAA